MCCLVEIGMFVFGIVTLVKGKFQLSRTKVVVGAPAYVIGAILTAVLPVVLLLGIVVGAVFFARTGQEPTAQQRLAFSGVDLAVVAAALVATMAIAFTTAKEPKRKSSPTPFGPAMPPTAPVDPKNPYAAPQTDDRDRLLDDLQ